MNSYVHTRTVWMQGIYRAGLDPDNGVRTGLELVSVPAYGMHVGGKSKACDAGPCAGPLLASLTR